MPIFFRGRFGVNVHEDDGRDFPNAFDFGLHHEKRIFERLHERAALHVNDGDRRFAVEAEQGGPLPWCSRRIIQGPDKARFVGEQFTDFLLVPQVVATGDMSTPT